MVVSCSFLKQMPTALEIILEYILEVIIHYLLVCHSHDSCWFNKAPDATSVKEVVVK
jgi:hypothetical protein